LLSKHIDLHHSNPNIKMVNSSDYILKLYELARLKIRKYLDYCENGDEKKFTDPQQIKKHLIEPFYLVLFLMSQQSSCDASDMFGILSNIEKMFTKVSYDNFVRAIFTLQDVEEKVAQGVDTPITIDNSILNNVIYPVYYCLLNAPDTKTPLIYNIIESYKLDKLPNVIDVVRAAMKNLLVPKKRDANQKESNNFHDLQDGLQENLLAAYINTVLFSEKIYTWSYAYKVLEKYCKQEARNIHKKHTNISDNKSLAKLHAIMKGQIFKHRKCIFNLNITRSSGMKKNGVKSAAIELDEKKKLDGAISKWESVQIKSAKKNSLQDKSNEIEQKALQEEAANYGFDCINTKHDGNCFFEAVATRLNAIKHNDREDHDATTVRAICINHMENNQHLYIGIYEGNKGNSWDDFIKKMSKNGEWANSQIIVACSRACEVSIAIVRSDKASPNIVKHLNWKEVQIIYLGYEVSVHYQSLQSNIQDCVDGNSKITTYLEKSEVDTGIFNFKQIPVKENKVDKNNEDSEDKNESESNVENNNFLFETARYLIIKKRRDVLEMLLKTKESLVLERLQYSATISLIRFANFAYRFEVSKMLLDDFDVIARIFQAPESSSRKQASELESDIRKRMESLMLKPSGIYKTMLDHAKGIKTLRLSAIPNLENEKFVVCDEKSGDFKKKRFDEFFTKVKHKIEKFDFKEKYLKNSLHPMLGIKYPSASFPPTLNKKKHSDNIEKYRDDSHTKKERCEYRLKHKIKKIPKIMAASLKSKSNRSTNINDRVIIDVFNPEFNIVRLKKLCINRPLHPTYKPEGDDLLTCAKEQESKANIALLNDLYAVCGITKKTDKKSEAGDVNMDHWKKERRDLVRVANAMLEELKNYRKIYNPQGFAHITSFFSRMFTNSSRRQTSENCLNNLKSLIKAVQYIDSESSLTIYNTIYGIGNTYNDIPERHTIMLFFDRENKSELRRILLDYHQNIKGTGEVFLKSLLSSEQQLDEHKQHSDPINIKNSNKKIETLSLSLKVAEDKLIFVKQEKKDAVNSLKKKNKKLKKKNKDLNSRLSDLESKDTDKTKQLKKQAYKIARLMAHLNITDDKSDEQEEKNTGNEYNTSDAFSGSGSDLSQEEVNSDSNLS
ncbi:MAG: hypothetical protein COB50_04970, partial [Thiotrichales bacterium]